METETRWIDIQSMDCAISINTLSRICKEYKSGRYIIEFFCTTSMTFPHAIAKFQSEADRDKTYINLLRWISDHNNDEDYPIFCIYDGEIE